MTHYEELGAGVHSAWIAQTILLVTHQKKEFWILGRFQRPITLTFWRYGKTNLP